MPSAPTSYEDGPVRLTYSTLVMKRADELLAFAVGVFWTHRL